MKLIKSPNELFACLGTKCGFSKKTSYWMCLWDELSLFWVAYGTFTSYCMETEMRYTYQFEDLNATPIENLTKIGLHDRIMISQLKNGSWAIVMEAN